MQYSPCGQMDFSAAQAVHLPADQQPLLLCVIDTEEEFDWEAEPSRSETGVRNLELIGRVQDIFDDYAIAPCYVIDFPVASKEQGYRELKKIANDGRCEIGAHLHPWVSPPFDEPLSRANMYPGNLSRDQEYAKLAELSATIEENFGHPPSVYKAGRYGFGPNTLAILQSLGFDIDLSFCPPVDYRADGGPDFTHCVATPSWLDDEKSVLEIPVTGAFTGCCGKWAHAVYQQANRLKRFKVPAVLSRLSIVDRLMLSPEGFASKEHIALTKYLFGRGVRTFTWSFHSSSVEPGCAPYVRNDAELAEFLQSFRVFFDFFFNELGGRAITPTGLKTLLESHQ